MIITAATMNSSTLNRQKSHLRKRTGGLKEMQRKMNNGLKIKKMIGSHILKNKQNFTKKKQSN